MGRSKRNSTYTMAEIEDILKNQGVPMPDISASKADEEKSGGRISFPDGGEVTGLFSYAKYLAAKAANGAENIAMMHLYYAYAQMMSMDEAQLWKNIHVSDAVELKKAQIIVSTLREISYRSKAGRRYWDIAEKVLPEFIESYVSPDPESDHQQAISLLQRIESGAMTSPGSISSRYFDSEVITRNVKSSVSPATENDAIWFYQLGFHLTEHAEAMDFFSSIASYRIDLTKKNTERFEAHNSESINKAFTENDELLSKLKEKIVGQDYAIQQFSSACLDAELFSNNPKRPKATFLFVGPPGVGKTYLAETAAEATSRKFHRFDMSEYSGDDKSAQGLIGFESTYKSAVPGVLTSFVEQNPDAIILFDEVEKAAPEVKKIFLQILEGARLTDKYTERTVSFENTILIFTTNAGKDLYEGAASTNLSLLSQNTIISALRNDAEFPNELVSRFASGNIILFNYVGYDALEQIAKNAIYNTANAFRKLYQTNITFDYSSDLPQAIIMRENVSDARYISSKAVQMTKELIKDVLSAARDKNISINDIKKIAFHFTTGKEDPEVYKFLPPVKDNQANYDYQPIRILYVTDAKDIPENPSIERYPWIHIAIAKSLEEMQAALSNKTPVDVAIVNLTIGGAESDRQNLLSGKNIGKQCIDTLFNYPEHPSVYIETTNHLNERDLSVFFLKGVSGTLPSFRNNIKEWQKMAVQEYFLRTMRHLRDNKKVFDFDHTTTIRPITDNRNSQDGYLGHIQFRNYQLKETSGYDESARETEKALLLNESDRSDITFDDIIGQDSAKEQLKEFTAYIDNPVRFEASNCPVSKGILLYGNPGTGKTMLAKAAANECHRNVSFIPTSGSDLKNGILDKALKAISDVFETARRNSPAIVFIDEFDALAAQRSSGGRNDTYDNAVLEKLLTEMDGFKNHKDKIVFVIAATNANVDEENATGISVKIDPAITRRFSKSIYVDLPTPAERKELIRSTLKKMHQDISDESISVVADLTEGKSQADIVRMIQYAVRSTIMDDIKKDNDSNHAEAKNDAGPSLMTDDSFLNKVQDFIYGEKTSDDEISESDESLASRRKMTALHEAGHAFMTWKMGETPSLLTVAPRGDALGFVQPTRTHQTQTKEWILEKIDSLLAGRASEIVFNGETPQAGINTGARGDLKQATFWAKKMITEYGMSNDQLGVISENMLINSPISERIMDEVNSTLKEEMKKTINIISQNKETVGKIAYAALNAPHYYITSAEISAICEQQKN